MKQQGWTIIQTMIVLLIAGLIGAYAVSYVIDKRCEEDPSRSVCSQPR
jgi:Tfp pilus assembly protein PilE